MSRPPGDPADLDDALDAPWEDDLALEDDLDDPPEGASDDDLLEDGLFPEDPLALDDLGPESVDPPFDELAAFPDEDAPDDLILLAEDDAPAAPPPSHLVALPWRTRAALPALQLDLPATLDPTRPDSEWRVSEPPDVTHIETRIRLGGVECRARLHVVRGEPTGLILGRVVLAGRVLVQS